MQYSDKEAGAAPNHSRCLHQIRFADTAQFCGEARRVVAHEILECGETVGMGVDVGAIDQPFPDQVMQHAVEQRDIGAGLDRQMQVGHRCSIGAARIDDDPADRRVGGFGRFQPSVQHRMRIRHVAASKENGLRVLEIFVAGRRAIGAQRQLVGGDRRRHAQARIGVDIVGAHQALGELVEEIVIFGQQLAGYIECDRIRAMLRIVRRSVAQPSPMPIPNPRADAASCVQAASRDTSPAPPRFVRSTAMPCPCCTSGRIGRMRGVAGNAGDAAMLRLDQHAAADAA